MEILLKYFHLQGEGASVAHTGTAQPTGEERTIDFNLFENVFVEPTANLLMETCKSKLNNWPQPQERVGRVNAWHSMQYLYFMPALLQKSFYGSLSLGRQGQECSRIWDV